MRGSAGVTILFCALTMIVFQVMGPSGVNAREPKAVTVSFFDNKVCGEPGEDPHLKIDPDIQMECIWLQGSAQGGGETYDSRGCPISGVTHMDDVRAPWRFILNYSFHVMRSSCFGILKP